LHNVVKIQKLKYQAIFKGRDYWFPLRVVSGSDAMIKKAGLIGLLIVIAGTLLIMEEDGQWNALFFNPTSAVKTLDDFYSGYNTTGSICLNENSDVAQYPFISGSGVANDPFLIENAVIT